MANSENSTVTRETTSNGSALWRIVVADFEREKAAFEKVDAEYSAALGELEARAASTEEYRAEEVRFDAACDKLANARERLIATPAPDGDALLYKLDTLTAYLVDCDSEDKERVQAIEADCKRILGRA